MLYDYQDKRQIYSIDTKLNAAATCFQWINPSASSLLVEATHKGSVYIWDLPQLDSHRQPRMVSSFVAFPVFAKIQPDDQSVRSSMVFDWNQESGLLVTAGTTQLVKVWNMDTEQLVCCKETNQQVPVISVIPQDTYSYLCCLTNGQILNMDIRCKEVSSVYSTVLKGSRFVNMVRTSQNTIAVGEYAGTLRLIDPRTFSEISSCSFLPSMSCIQAHPSMSTMIASSMRSELLLSNCMGEKLQSICALTGFRAASLGHLMAVAMHPLDTTVACYNTNGIVSIFG